MLAVVNLTVSAPTNITTITTPTATTIMRWPENFIWSTSGAISEMNCVHIVEPSDPLWKDADNYLCHESGPGIRDIGLKWSYAG